MFFTPTRDANRIFEAGTDRADGAPHDPAYLIVEFASVISAHGGSKHRLMALLRAFCDASFTEAMRSPGITAIGGYLGTAEMWREVEKCWVENKRLWNLEEFSVAKILAGEAVGYTDAELCVRSFGRIISGSGLEGVSAAIDDADWEHTYKSERFPNKYHSCLSMLFHVLDQHVSAEFKGDSVAVVLDTDRTPDDALEALCKEWKHESPVIASITFGRRPQFPMLECADLCAGTERRAQMAGGWQSVVREPLWFAISHARRHRGAFWSLETQKRNEEAHRKREEWKRRRRVGEG